MQRYDNRSGGNPSNTTFALAQFLATTGPDEYVNQHNVSFDSRNIKSIPSNKINLFERLRKKTSHANTKHIQQQQQQHHRNNNQNEHSYSAWATPSSSPLKVPHKKYIPLIDDINQPNLQNIHQHQYQHHHHQQQQQQQQTSFYEAENGSFNNNNNHHHHVGEPLPSFPTPPASSLHESLENPQTQEPFSSSSASETSSTPITRSKTITTTRADPSTSHKKKPIRGLRHMQVQTDDDDLFTTNQIKEEEKEQHPSLPSRVTALTSAAAAAAAAAVDDPSCPEDKDRCELCTRPFNRRYLKPRPQDRRASCPAVLASGAKIQLGHEATVLLALIEQLKQQLNEEQKSRKLLEKAIHSQWLEKK
ncbi:unnamed protein product [Absidia cylindrospora]